MTDKERVLRAMDGLEVDYAPVGFWYHFSPDDDFGQETVEEHLNWYERSQGSFIKVMCDGYFNYPNPGIQDVKEAEDWFRLTPLGAEHPYIRKQIERVKGVVKGVQGKACVFYNVFNPMSLMRFGSSEERMMKHLRENPEAVCYAFSVIAKDVKVLIDGVLKEAGADGIYFCVQNAETFRFTEEEYKKYVRPYELELLEYANTLSSYNMLHCCGWAGDKNRVEVWRDYPAKAINWAVYVEDMKLEEGREFFGCSCVVGGFDNRKSGVLYSGTKEEIKKETKRILARAGVKGTILAADCTIPADMPVEHLHWVVEASKEYGNGDGKWDIAQGTIATKK